MLFISTGIFYDKLRLQIVSVGTTAKSPLTIKIQVKFKFEIIDFGGSLVETLEIQVLDISKFSK
jgi:hypothetical protein